MVELCREGHEAAVPYETHQHVRAATRRLPGAPDYTNNGTDWQVIRGLSMAPDPQLAPSPPNAVPAGTHGVYTRARTDSELMASWLAGLNSERSRANFGTTGARFLASLSARGLTLRSATVEDIREAIAALGEGMAASTRAQYAMRAKSLLGYAHRLGYLPFNAGAAVRVQGGTVDRAKRIVRETEIALLIRAAGSVRDRLLFEVAYAAGLRVSELVALRWSDVLVRDERVQLSVTGKGGKLRHVLLPAVVSRSLLAYRADRADDEPVFSSRLGGRPIEPRQVNRLIKRAADRAGVNSAVSAHWLRHAHASHALARGATVAEVAETLGHGNISTTSVYLHAAPDRSSGLLLDDGVFVR
jgi:site-specific recombinase XerD